ncbi:hypothetical protein V8J82_07795 [Gymnodinialimonas sp. 2305UL16-5]|uniref:hypothetical protein n=1 Tax=Gymnodinialimonas mytili TaxID=3126503 RepID=UPI0030A1F0B3
MPFKHISIRFNGVTGGELKRNAALCLLRIGVGQFLDGDGVAARAPNQPKRDSNRSLAT